MLDNFNKMCDDILKESTEDEVSKPSCAYCGVEVPIEQFNTEKKNYEEKFGNNTFKPNMCVCKSCAENLMKFYSDTTSNWRGD